MANTSSSQYDFGATPYAWDNTTLDPQLFPQGNTSELAGAMGFPTPPVAHSSRNLESQERLFPRSALQTPSNRRSEADISSADIPGPSVVGASSPPKTKAAISVEVLSEAATQLDGPMPPRFCSIKGCKTVLSGSIFYKMCEPCRSKYRNYGSKKRRKWKDDKDIAVAELERLQQEDMERINNGLPVSRPLHSPNVEQILNQDRQPLHLQPEWQFDLVQQHLAENSAASEVNIARMCTVSHCREILPPSHKYLRCERHRVQNRHHSKLKRVRDKESKARVVASWVAARVDQSPDSTQHIATPASTSDSESGSEDDSDNDTGHTRDDEDTAGSSHALNGGLLLFPPGIRGKRRSNHVCSMKTCQNLLSLESPWKTCEFCRLRDRARVRSRSARDEEGAAGPSSVAQDTIVTQPPAKKKRKKSSLPSDFGESTGNAQDARSGPTGVLIFMEPVLPPENSVTSDVCPEILFVIYTHECTRRWQRVPLVGDRLFLPKVSKNTRIRARKHVLHETILIS